MTLAAKHVSLALTLSVVALATALPAGTAAASSGEITRAEATAGWTQASIAGTVEWTGCEHWVEWEPNQWELEFPGDYHELLESLEPPRFAEYGEFFPFQYCGWLPYATVGPGSEPSDCESDDRDLFGLGAEVDLVWEGEPSTSWQQIFFETASFDETEGPLSNPNNRLACLSIIEVAPKPEAVVCVEEVGVICPPFVIAKFRHEVASALLTCVGPESGGPPSSVPPQSGEKNQGSCAAGRDCGSPKGMGCLHRHRPLPSQARISKLTLP